ncbi:MAG: glutamine synthetase family protein [Pseudomonadota bacterium]
MPKIPTSKQSQIVYVITNDFGGLTRGRGLVLPSNSSPPKSGIGWVPVNITITPFDTIGPNPFGPTGDIRVLPDLKTKTTFQTASGDQTIYIGDIYNIEGERWSCCPRSILKKAIETLENDFGLKGKAAFEHEFLLEKIPQDESKAAPGFSLQAYLSHKEFAETLVKDLQAAGVNPELFLPEFGARQYEVPIAPADFLRAADDAVLFREVVKQTARKLSYRACFSPKPRLDGAGNGCHIHFSLTDKNGKPINFDRKQPGQISRRLGNFAAGILNHIEALLALTTPSVVSYHRLKPHNWSNAYACFGLQNREATLRICPAVSPKQNPKKIHHLEFRAADSTHSPYLALAGLIFTGIDGLRNDLPAPPLVNVEPDELTLDECEQLGVRPLPTRLDESLAALRANTVLSEAFGAEFLGAYDAMKTEEMRVVAEMPDEAVCEVYRDIY